MLNHRQIYIALHILDIYGCIVDCVGGLLLQLVVLLDPLPDPLEVSCLGSLADVGAGCSLCLLRALLRALLEVELVLG